MLDGEFGDLVEPHVRSLSTYARAVCGNRWAAEDAVQETFLAALKAYEKFEGRGSERTWLVGILKHKIIDHFRKVEREAPIGEGFDEGPEHAEFFERTDEWVGHWNANRAPSEWHATPAELIERSDFWKVFGDCLSPLPQRTVGVPMADPLVGSFKEIGMLRTFISSFTDGSLALGLPKVVDDLVL